MAETGGGENLTMGTEESSRRHMKTSRLSRQEKYHDSTVENKMNSS